MLMSLTVRSTDVESICSALVVEIWAEKADVQSMLLAVPSPPLPVLACCAVLWHISWLLWPVSIVAAVLGPVLASSGFFGTTC